MKGATSVLLVVKGLIFDAFLQKFSPCSLRAIRAVLVAKSSRCFTEPEESYCGNQRVEGQEECDAGLVGQNDVDTCCDKNCQLRPTAKCSDKNSPCCQNCDYMQRNYKCREEQKATCERVRFYKCKFFIYIYIYLFFLRDFIFEKTLFEKLQY